MDGKRVSAADFAVLGGLIAAGRRIAHKELPKNGASAICRLRMKFGEDIIESAWGRGYFVTAKGRAVYEAGMGAGRLEAAE